MDKIKRKIENLKSGIDLNLIIDEKNALIEEALCKICLSLSINPEYCKNCEKIFFNICIKNWLQKSSSCPNCRQYTFEKPPLILLNFLSKIRMKCHNSKCNKLLLYGDMNNT